MSWEAYRWTAKTPSELYQTLGPHGVDHLVRQMLDACWRESPAEGRTLASVRAISDQVVQRNMAVWARIKKPSPDAFFEDLLPQAADQFFRQAMVVCWMMMPRTGGRDVADVRRIVKEIYARNVAAWEQDEATFIGKKKPRATKRARQKPAKRASKRSAGRKAKARR